MTDDSFQLAKNALLRFTIILYIIYIIYNIIVTFSFFSFENCHLSSVIDTKLTFQEMSFYAFQNIVLWYHIF